MLIAILNGPNLNKLGRRTPDLYGSESMESILLAIQRRYPSVHFLYAQSNHEGDLIDRLQEWAESEVDGIVMNAGGYSHTSVALRDAVAYVTEQAIPVVEVHITDIRKREAFRQLSLLTDVSTHTIIGHGTDGYREAVEYILTLKSDNNES